MPHNEPDAGVLISDLTWAWPPLQDATASIRLLHLHPDSGKDEICGDLRVHGLKSAPAFKAISYTWGTEPSRQVIKINGSSISVRPSCHYAIWQARHHFSGSVVWIDAICINQNDLIEKSSQVAMMGDIYAAATDVLACVGPADYYSNAIRTALSNLDMALQIPPTEWYANPDLSQWKPPQDVDTTMRLSAAFNHFCSRAYFTRVWIIQELHGGRNRIKILCGSGQLKWDALMELYARLTKCFDFWDDVAYFVTTKTKLHEIGRLINFHSESDFPLTWLLSKISEFACSDPRDRIFGTLRLIDWARFGKLAPTPDYQVSSLQLALNLMTLLDKQNLYILKELVRVLRLDNRDSSLETWLQTKQNETESYKRLSSHENTKGWLYLPYSAHYIRRDTKGQLSIDLEGHKSANFRQYGLHGDPSLPSDSPENFGTADVAQEIVKIFSGDDVVALVGTEAQPGDIITTSHFGDLVLHPQPDGFSFHIAGPALTRIPTSSDIEQKCICWQEDLQDAYTKESVMLTLDLSDEDTVIALASLERVRSGNCDVPSYLKYYSLGTLRRGSIISDVTMANLGKDKIFGPLKGICVKHRLSERYRSSGQALWNQVISNGDMSIHVKSSSCEYKNV